MENRLTIGIVRLRPGWRIVLDQLGVAYEVIRRWEDVSPDRYSAIIVDAEPDSSGLKALETYLQEGGAVLDGGHYLPMVEPKKIRRQSLRSIAADAADELFRDIWLADIDASVLLHRESDRMGRTVHLGQRGAGFVAYVPFDIGELIRDGTSRRRPFYAALRSLPNEIVARVSKGEIRRIVEIALRWLHARRGLPYVHRWYFPGRLPSIFCFRVDSDYGTPAQIDALYSVAREYRMRMTWFLHVDAHHEWLDRFGAMGDQELALHGYRHRTFGGYEENLANIMEAAALLKRADIRFTGFAAPNGFWNPALCRAVEEAGLLYSSEFSLAYDDLPFYPDLYGKRSPVLQVPIHPICIGSMLRGKADPEMMKEYFRMVIRRKLQRHEPVILYGHPGHERWDVTADSFAYVRELGVENFTMGEYAAWWLKREETRFDATFNGDSVTVRFRRYRDGVHLALHDGQGRLGFVGADGCWRLSALEWSAPVRSGDPSPADIRRAREWSPALLRHGIEDYNARARQ